MGAIMVPEKNQCEKKVRKVIEDFGFICFSLRIQYSDHKKEQGMNKMNWTPLRGLIAATYTPMNEDGSLRMSEIPAMVNRLEKIGIKGIFVAGSTGEGLSLTSAERKAIAEAYTKEAHGRMKVIIHVGHHCLDESAALSRHAKEIGADAIAAVAPSYYKIGSAATLVQVLKKITSGAPDLPFYYYDIAALTGIDIDIEKLLLAVGDSIPSLVGVKYTSFRADQYLHARMTFGSRYDMVWGFDEVMLAGLAMGARASIGSTFNLAAPLYIALMKAFDEGRMEEAQKLQALSVKMIRRIGDLPFHPAMKALITRCGVPCGPARPPMASISAADVDKLWKDLEQMGATAWFSPR